MASVAICPHCYLQLVVPDGIKPDERVECPTCAKEFGLDQVVLRAIPEVARRPHRAAIAEPTVAEPVSEKVVIEEVVEIDELVTAADDAEGNEVIEEIKTRIEAEIAARALPPGTNTLLSLGLPAEDAESRTQVPDELAAWFRNAKTVPELPPVELVASTEHLDSDVEIEEPSPLDEEIAAGIDEIRAETDAESVIDGIAPEPIESRLTKPTVRTLAELMPSREMGDEKTGEDVEAATGPSFDLPNVPLVPNNGATIEIDPSTSFGPAAETEFELDDVDFESMPAEEDAVDESADESAPVFSEPKYTEPAAAPFVLPAIPRTRKKRSVVRTLVGTALGGVVGLSLGYFILLYLLGPEGDLLQVAKFFPSAVLPKSFAKESTPLAGAGRAPAPVQESAPKPIDVVADGTAAEDESANVPAGYVEETKTPSEPVAADEPAGNDRYGTEPAPLDEPAAEPIAEDTPITALAPLRLHGPTFTTEQLATALEVGKAALSGLMTGDLNDASVRRTKGMSYAKLCDLAQALTFVDRSSPSIESEDAIAGSDRLFREVLSDSRTQNEVARIAEIWIASPHRKHGGIFLASTVRGGQIAGDVYEYELPIDDGNGGKLTLLMREPLDASVAGSERPVEIIGTIVDNPAENVTGYQGTAKCAIWAARAIPLD